MQHDQGAPFDLDTPFRQVPALGSLLQSLTQRALAFERLANIHRQAGGRTASPADFAARALGLLQVRFELDERQLERIPRTGPAVVVANHPHGGLALLIDFLRRHCFDAQLAKLVRPRRAFRRTHSLAALSGDLARLADLDDISQLLEAIEPDGKGAPVLLRQYLKLGGRLACFNVDESFSGVIDGLIVVDLLRTAPKVLQKYMGREQAAAFISYATEQPRISSDTHAVS